MIYIWKRCGIPHKGVNGMAMSWAKSEKRVGLKEGVKPADVFTIYNKQLKRIGHVGLVYQTYPEEPFFQSFEGNVNARGDRESHRSCAMHLIRQYDFCSGFFRWWGCGR